MRWLVFHPRFLLCCLAFVSVIAVLTPSLLVFTSPQHRRCPFSEEVSGLRVTHGSTSAVKLAAIEYQTKTNGQKIPRLIERPSHSTNSPSPVAKRRSLFIMGYDRSGTTFVSNMFAQDPGIFLVYEPLWITQNMRIYEPGDHLQTCELDVVSAILTCNFSKTPAAKQFLTHTNEDWLSPALRLNVFTSRHFCNLSGPGYIRHCPRHLHNVKADLVDKVCSSEYKHSVVKVSPTRVPGGKLSVFVPQILVENPEHDIRIVHIVRDPRASIHSRIKLKWMHDYPDIRLQGETRETCNTILSNLKHAERMKAWLGKRYTILRYKDIAETPIETARRLYDFAGFDMPDNLTSWIVKMTQPSREMILKKSNEPYSSVRNSTGNAERWRNESPVKRVRIIEKICGPLLDFLGLDRVTSA